MPVILHTLSERTLRQLLIKETKRFVKSLEGGDSWDSLDTIRDNMRRISQVIELKKVKEEINNQ